MINLDKEEILILMNSLVSALKNLLLDGDRISNSEHSALVKLHQALSPEMAAEMDEKLTDMGIRIEGQEVCICF